MNHKNTFRLRLKHKDFICKQLALFKTHRQVAAALLEEFPNLPLSPDEALSRVKFYASDNRTHKWRNRVIEYRRMQEFQFANRYRLANKHQRMIEFERIFAEAMTPKLRRVVWFPISKGRKGEITYGHKEVHELDLRTAVTVLEIIHKIVDDYCLSPYGPPVPLRKSLSAEEIYEIARKHLKKLDLTFGLK